MFIHHRQSAGQSQANRTDLCVGRRTEFRTATAKQLGLRLELDVNFKSDDRFGWVSAGAGHDALPIGFGRSV